MRSSYNRPPRWVEKNGKIQAHLLEEHVLQEIVERLWLQARIRMWRIRERIPGKGLLSIPGIPDLIGHLPMMHTHARVLYIEVKRPGGVRRPAQEQFIAEARADGCVAFFAESWADVVREMSEAGVQL